jgi:DNA-binding GntR family transcriptional regulator
VTRRHNPEWEVSIGDRRRVSVGDLAYDSLREAIVRGHLEPGAPISEEMLAQRVQISRTPLRQALQRLEAQGLIGRAANGRLFVTELSVKQARHVFSVRGALEDLAIVEAFPHVDERILSQLDEWLQRMRASYAAPGGDVAETGRGFHNVIYRAAGNPINQAMLDQLKVLVDRYRFVSTATGSERQLFAIEEHEALFQAIRDGDLEATRASMREHLRHAQDSALHALGG